MRSEIVRCLSDGAKEAKKRKHRSNGEKMRARRDSLFRQQGGRCYWCRCLCEVPPYAPKLPRLAANAATIDHLFPRFHPKRRATTPGQRLVMACNSCNHRRGREEYRAIGLPQQWKRSNSYPLEPQAPVPETASFVEGWLVRVTPNDVE